MDSSVRPELPTAALRSSQATHAAVDNSAPVPIRPESTCKSEKVVQTNGTTSVAMLYLAGPMLIGAVTVLFLGPYIFGPARQHRPNLPQKYADAD